MLRLLLCFAAALLVASFEVIVTNKHLLAIRGGSAVLGCEFTPDPDLSNLVVTWQRSENSQVVHSFYYQQDQLDRQSAEFHNRTSLFISELHKGNASLRIAEVRPKDAGLYLCIVSNAKGTGKALMNVTYGALYSEPRLSIHVNSSALTVQFETEGFPKPEVIWLDEHGQNLNYHLELHGQTEDGLYLVKSSYEAQKPAVNVTFTLKNHLLNQNLQRPVFLNYDKDTTANKGTIALVLSVVCVFLVIAIIWFVRRRNKGRPSAVIVNHQHVVTIVKFVAVVITTTRGIVSTDATNLSDSHSSPVGGGNTPKLGLSTPMKPYKKKLKCSGASFICVKKNIMVSAGEVFCLLLVAILWGGTNPFLKKGSEGIEGVQRDNKLLQFLAEIKFLFLNLKYLVPFLLNQSGSVVFYFTLASTDLSLAVPMVNSLTFLFTLLMGKLVGEDFGGKGALLGMLLIMSGVTLCILSSVSETDGTGLRNTSDH